MADPQDAEFLDAVRTVFELSRFSINRYRAHMANGWITREQAIKHLTGCGFSETAAVAAIDND